MKEFDICVVGSGIGGSLISALNKDKNLALFEKDNNLGGCASTFKHKNHFFNVGATTFVGYEDNHLIKKMFDKIDFVPNIKKSDIAIRVIQNKKIIDRIKNFDEFLENIERLYPHKNNRLFWQIIKDIDQEFWKISTPFYDKYSIKNYYDSFFSFMTLLKSFKFNFFKSAKSFISEVLPNISKEYKNFIDAQLLITVQSKSDDINLLSMALGLSYPFHDVFYANGGMGNLITELLGGVDIKKREEIIKIVKDNKDFILVSNKDEYKAKKVVLNSTIYDSYKLFEDKDINSYYHDFDFNDQSAFVVYLTLNTNVELLHHYQIILDENIPFCISNSFFVSISDKDDDIMTKNGCYSVTISTHSNASTFIGLSKQEYENRKKIVGNFILFKFLENFDNIFIDDVKTIIAGTSKTFNRFINRKNCGGQAVDLKKILSLATNSTPFDNIYNIGDTIFSGQGWPGVAIGVNNLNRSLNDREI
jgi:phytoene dehydrogenase-like protein